MLQHPLLQPHLLLLGLLRLVQLTSPPEASMQPSAVAARQATASV
jgi:hypothetical protein